MELLENPSTAVSSTTASGSGAAGGAATGFRQFLRDHRRLFLLIALCEFLFLLFVFRGVLWAVPSIARGEAVVTADELVPFFDLRTQFLDQAIGLFSSLTNQYEFRIRYAILTTWMRHYLVLPFALLFVPLICSVAMCAAVSYFLLRITRRFSATSIIRASALASFFFEMVLLYAKVTHFYSLIIGFTLFTIAFILLLFGLFLEQKHPLRFFVAASLLTLLNPAVHYIVLLLLTIVVLLVGGAALRMGERSPDGERSLSYALRVSALLFFAVFLVALPYALLVQFFFLKGLGDVEEQVPISYLFIRSSSVPLFQQLGFDISSILNNFLYGNYTLTQPRFANYFYFLLTLAPFLPGMISSIAPGKRERKILYLVLILLVFSMWCSLGYAGAEAVPTFHRVLSAVVMSLANVRNAFTWMLVSVINAGVVVLRFPHRFQFLTFTAALCLMPLGIAWTEERVRRIFVLLPRAKSWFASTGICVLFLLPLFCNWDYRYALLSGDLGGFLRPYPLQQLREVKIILDRLPQGPTIVIPPSEAAKRILDADGAMHKFIDKFYIYYLNKPSYYYGMNASTANKLDFFLFYRSLLYGEYWWINVLRERGIRYVVVNKELGPNPVGGVEYLKGIEKAVSTAFPRSSFAFKKRFENRSFVLYEFIDAQDAHTTQLYFDVPWDEFVCYQQSSLTLSKQYTVLYNPKIMDVEGQLDVVTTDRKKAELDLSIKYHPDSFTVPDNTTVPFDANVLPSTFYSGNIYSMATLLRATQFNYFRIILPALYDTLTGTFMGMLGPTSLHFHASVPETGTYQVLLRAVSTKNHLRLSDGETVLDRSVGEENSTTQYFWRNAIYSDSRKVVDTSTHTQEQLSSRILTDIVPVSYQFDYLPMGTMHLEKGTVHFILEKTDQNPFVIEGILLRGSGAALSPLPSTIRFIDPATLSLDHP